MESQVKKTSKFKEFLSRYGMASLFTLPFIVCFIFFTVVPIFIGLYLSFFKYNPMMPEKMEFVGLDNYINLFLNDEYDIVAYYFWPALGKTLLFTILTVPIMFFFPLFLAVLINYEPPGYKIFRSILYLPCILSISTAGILFVTIFGMNESSLFNAFFHTNINFLENEVLRWIVMILLSVWWQSGTNFVIFSAALKNVPKSLYEACESDGGNRFSSFIHVTLPNIKGSLTICLFNTLIGYLSLYGQPTVIKGEINADSIDSPLMLLQDWLNDMTFASMTGYLTAVAIIFGIFVMIISLTQRYLMGLEKGGHKREEQYKTLQSLKK